MSHGRLLSWGYLFQKALAVTCAEAELVDATGRPTISAHRFRHTVGTQLAERGAKLHTIMSVLGHRSASMSFVYARISDKEVLRDYQSVLAPGSVIAGPGADLLRSGALPKSAVDWLKCNFLKTELELGHCLRLPQEGPCECDIYLSCAKFITTPAYVPRLKERRRLERVLADHAAARSWTQEQGRHLAVARVLTNSCETLAVQNEPKAGRNDDPRKNLTCPYKYRLRDGPVALVGVRSVSATARAAPTSSVRAPRNNDPRRDRCRVRDKR
jgi:hypothetical protein